MERDEISRLRDRMAECPRVLLRLGWSPFSRDLEFDLGSDVGQQPTIYLRARGVHYFSVRQSLLGPAEGGPGPRCDVGFLDLDRKQAFVEALGGEKLPFPNQIVLYDLSGKHFGHKEFAWPVHLTISCDGGTIDVICEDLVELDKDVAARAAR